MRQQFPNETTVRVSPFAAGFAENFRTRLDDEERVPELILRSLGYLYLAVTDDTP